MYGIVDCDNCYVSCERVFRPDLEGKVVVVLSNNDGCVVARSNEAKALGIKIVDVRIKQINLPPEVSNSIYQRMRAERDAVAKLHRSQGRKEAEAIKAHADREVVVKIAEAERQARTLRGEGDAEATRIYAQAYKQNPQLFEFLRSMDAYKKSMSSGKDVLVLKPDSEFFKFFNDANGAKGTN